MLQTKDYVTYFNCLYFTNECITFTSVFQDNLIRFVVDQQHQNQQSVLGFNEAAGMTKLYEFSSQSRRQNWTSINGVAVNH